MKTIVTNAIAVLGVSCLCCFSQGCAATGCVIGQEDEAGHETRHLRIVVIDELLSADSPITIEVMNSGVQIMTPGIGRVIKMGTNAIPQLVELMTDDALSFDTFARCYTAANQILQEAGVVANVLWYGGGSVSNTSCGPRVFPRGQNVITSGFRKAVSDDVVSKFKQLVRQPKSE
jgi:hypothetical protein